MSKHSEITSCFFTISLCDRVHFERYPNIRFLLFILIFLWISVQTSAQNKWQKEPVKADPVICDATEETGHSFIAPPEGFLNRLKSGNKTSNIVVQYVNVPDSVKPAIEYAAEIWEYLVSSPVTIYMRVNWQALTAGTLGSCGPGNYYVNFDGAPSSDTYYPVAVVEKITEKELTGPGTPDMIAKFNSSASWYLGTDGKTPLTKYDLVSTVLHEIGHGLGFTGFFQANTSQKTASYGINDKLPAIFDRYVENFSKKRLTDITWFKNPSGDLYSAITSRQLYSGSPVAIYRGSGNRPQLYAPATYTSGSSIYHLDDFTYPFGTVNTLMTSGAGKGEAVHSPGPLASGILADIGWKLLYIRYKPLKDREEIIDSLDFRVIITSDLGIRDHSAYLVYSFDRFGAHKDSVFFRPTGEPGIFSAKLFPGFSRGTISYYLTAGDTIGRRFTLPQYIPDSVLTLTIGPDTIKPVISHQPVKFILSSAKTFEIAAFVTDNTAVGNVSVVLNRNNREPITENLIPGKNNLYSRTFNLSEYGLGNDDFISYYFIASDSSRLKNSGRLPGQGSFSVIVEDIRQPVTEYSNDFEKQQEDFILSDFKISRESNFDNYALHSPHPYPSPDKDNDSLEFMTVFRYPVILAENGHMSFDEVVLVEPGEGGAVFGDSEFWDYVIVEGSKDQGKNWLPLADGYDSGSQASWLTVYNGKMSGNNSIANGSKELFVKRVINLTGNGIFKAGDTLLIRFRLFSDPYAHGWGWAIDNLNIQNKTSSGREVNNSPGSVILWPNPARNSINLTIDRNKVIKRLDIEISDIQGSLLLKDSRSNIMPQQTITLDIGKFPTGIYLVRVIADDTLFITRRIMKNAK